MHIYALKWIWRSVILSLRRTKWISLSDTIHPSVFTSIHLFVPPSIQPPCSRLPLGLLFAHKHWKCRGSDVLWLLLCEITIQEGWSCYFTQQKPLYQALLTHKTGTSFASHLLFDLSYIFLTTWFFVIRLALTLNDTFVYTHLSYFFPPSISTWQSNKLLSSSPHHV